MAVGYGTGATFYSDAELGRYRISWGAVFAGVVVALVTLLALNLLGLSIGLGVLNPAAEQRFAAVGIGAGVWMILSTVISLFVGGWVAARMAGLVSPLRGIMHGIVMWSLVTLISFYLMTSTVGSLISGAASAIGQGVSAVATSITQVAPQPGQTIGQAVPGGVLNDAQNMIALSRRATNKPAAQRELNQALTVLFSKGDNLTAADRSQVADVLVAYTNMNRTEANRRVDQWVTQFQRSRTQVAQTAQQVTDTLSKAALWGFAAMILGAAASGFGGWLGARYQLEPLAPPAEPKERGA
ncbi:MAG: hypothetical protein HYS21_12930 [Deltaproteobacteria bacterium]|nr:hypothetical protein [Deltaproteobacteria bacterium]